MKKILLVPALLLVSGCLKENPLEKVDSKYLDQWLLENRTPAMSECAPYWADGWNIPSSVQEKCDNAADSLVTKINKASLSTEEIKREHLDMPAVWKRYNEKAERANEGMDISNQYKAMMSDCRRSNLKGRAYNDCFRRASQWREEAIKNIGE